MGIESNSAQADNVYWQLVCRLIMAIDRNSAQADNGYWQQ
jgi:hypothetical protein